MKRADYLRLLDSGMDNESIVKTMSTQNDTHTQPIDWTTDEHLETDFVTRPPLPVRVETDIVDKPPSQRLYGTPMYDRNGDLRCRSCGQVMARVTSNSGEGIAACANVGCEANGFAYAEGSFLRNPHRVRP